MNPISPHGGKLIQSLLSGKERSEALQESLGRKHVQVSWSTIADLELIATGAYSPLTGFMTYADYVSVVQNMRLSDGTVWPIPLVLPVEERVAENLSIGETVALIGNDGQCYALLHLKEIYTVDPMEEVQQVYGTDDSAHPGVAKRLLRSNTFIAGPIFVTRRPPRNRFLAFYSDPIETRRRFIERGWKKIVGFQTRNPIHRAHEYIQKSALETVDGLFLHPLVGETKSDDVPSSIRMKSYLRLLRDYYPRDRVVFSVFPAAMHYAGPREALLHAIVRKNYGCTHFIVGRDHAGVGSFYGTYDAQKLFSKFQQDEIGIQPYMFEHSFYCSTCNGMASLKTCPHPEKARMELSGTRVRAMLSQGVLPPPELTRPEIARILIQGMKTPE
jgi:sulfate adenylyltransferase